jgi:polysaccharide deacetylase 2 family uncharacterized protein YibQ
MAKKGGGKKPAPRKKKKKKGFDPQRQFFKIVAGLILLVCLVIAAGLLLNHFLMRPATPVIPKSKHGPITRSEKGPVHHKIPDYEAFHLEAVPPPPPITRIKPVTDGIPVAIIIDDIGYDRKLAEGFLALDVPLTFSVLPEATFGHSIIDEAEKKNVEIMLHLPMEPDNYPAINPGPGALLTSMSPDQLIAQLKSDLADVPMAKGVNNHMGSKLTASASRMRQIFTILKKRGLFFVDSRTTAATVCRPSAELLHLPFADRDVFLDDYQTPDSIKRQIKVLIKRARRQGYAIAIAHPHPVTLAVLKAILPELKHEVRLMHASQVVAFEKG